MKELAGRVALITGATGKIGRSTAERLASAGAAVMLTDTDAIQGEALADTLRAGGYQADFFALNGLDEYGWQMLIDRLIGAFGRLDVLVNTTRVEIIAPIQEMTLEQFRHAHHTVLHAAFLAVRFGIEAMRRHGEGGSIINVSGIAGRVSGNGLSALSSIDGGIRLLTKSTALEVGPEHIRVNALQIGADFLHDAADSIFFLAVDRSRFMTGADLVIDGGFLAGI